MLKKLRIQGNVTDFYEVLQGVTEICEKLLILTKVLGILYFLVRN